MQTYRAINPHFAEKRQKHCLINFSRQWQWLTFINHQLGKLKKKLFGILSKLHTSTDGAKEKLQFQIGSYLEPKYLWRTAKKRRLDLYQVVFHLLQIHFYTRFFLHTFHICVLTRLKENYKNLKKCNCDFHPIVKRSTYLGDFSCGMKVQFCFFYHSFRISILHANIELNKEKGYDPT